MERVGPRQTNYILAVVLIGIVVLYVMLVFLPNRREAALIQLQLQTDRAFIAKTAGLSAAIAKVQKELDQVEQYTLKWRKQMPSKAEIPRLFAKLDRLAAMAGVSTIRLDPLPIIEHQSIQQVPMTLAVAGTFTEVFLLLSGIETLTEPVWVDDIKIERTRKAGGSVECELKLVMFASKSEDSD
jgi:Tfp pilus assembly protein PilO